MIVEPKRDTGAIVLEDRDLLVDCLSKRVLPRGPSGPVYESE